MTPELVTARTKGGGFKVYVWKQLGLFAWNGSNDRLVSVPGQPRSFSNREDAEAWGRAWRGDLMALARSNDGTHLSDTNDRDIRSVKAEAQS